MQNNKSVRENKIACRLIQELPLYHFINENPMKITQVSSSFPIFLLENFISQEICSRIIAYGKDKLQPSTMFKEDKRVVGTARTSSTAFLTNDGEASPFNFLHSVQLKVSALSWFPISYLEALNLTYYAPGQCYQPHHDFFNPKLNENGGKMGQRVLTFFIYLNTVTSEQGGATFFPTLDLRIQPKVGSALMWMNASFDGKNLFPETLHSGEELIRGEKWAMNIWVREKPITS